VNLFDGYQWVNQALNLVQKLLNGSEPIMLSAFYNSSLWSKGICYTVVWGFKHVKITRANVLFCTSGIQPFSYNLSLQELA